MMVLVSIADIYILTLFSNTVKPVTRSRMLLTFVKRD
jgi:hypothetical protein